VIKIEGAEQLARLSKQLKDAADKDLQKELNQAINRALKPVKADIRASAAATLPKRGGLAGKVARSRITTRKRTSAKAAGIRLVATNTISLYHLNKGEVRHRKGGDINAGQVQPIPPGWFTRPAEAANPRVQAEIVQAMDVIAHKIVRGT
jgi:hypothetical protein